MRRAIASVFAFAFVAACSSSSTDTKAECFAGTYDVTYGAVTGDAACPSLFDTKTTATYVVNGASVSGPAPAGTTPGPANIFDENNCTATETFTGASSVAGCGMENTYAFDLTFSASGFSGTYKFTGCDTAPTPVTCTFVMSGKKR